jgi:chemotaxis protein CheD
MGSRRSALVAKIAGGANMFSSAGSTNTFVIGQRNVEACLKALEEQKIRLVSSDTGGNYGRTIEINTENGLLLIKTIGPEQNTSEKRPGLTGEIHTQIHTLEVILWQRH